MQQLPPWARVSIIILICIVLVLPIGLLLLKNPMIATLLPFRSAPSDRFNAQSDISGYTLQLADTQYIEYIAAKNNLFSPNAIIDLCLTA